LERFHPPGDHSGVPGQAEEEALSTPLRERPDAPLGTLIFRAGLLPAETIESALEEGVKTGKRLGEILTERGLLKEADLARLLAGQKGLEFVTLREQIVDPGAAGLFSEDQARLFRALPYAFEDGTPVVAIADPSDEVLTRNIREALGREDARFVVSVRSELGEIIGQVYAGDLAAAPERPQAQTPEPEGYEQPEAPAPQTEAYATEPEAMAPQPEAVPTVEPPPVEVASPSGPAMPDPGLVEAPHVDSAAGQNGAGAPEHVELRPAVEPSPEPAAPAPVATPQPVAAAEPVAAPPQPPLEQTVQPVFQVPAPEPMPEPVPSVADTHPASEQAPVAEAAPPEIATPAAEATPPEMPTPTAETTPPEMPAAGTTYRLSVRLTNGERVEAGAHGDLEAAKQQAKALMAQVAASDGGDWPFVNGRFLKPDTIVSVDIL
jgi:hypothetical protein